MRFDGIKVLAARGSNSYRYDLLTLPNQIAAPSSQVAAGTAMLKARIILVKCKQQEKVVTPYADLDPTALGMPRRVAPTAPGEVDPIGWTKKRPFLDGAAG